MVYAGVRILDVPAKADREFDYAVPEEFAPEIKAGSFVKVPLRGRRECTGLVTRLSDRPAEGLSPSGIKEISGLLPGFVSFSEAQMKVLGYLCSSTL